MSVLIGYTSATWSSVEIAQQLADRLMKAGVAAVVRPIDSIESLRPYQAIVLGSALDDQDWLPGAAEFLRKFSEDLARLPLWLFSAGSVKELGSPFDSRIAALLGHPCAPAGKAQDRVQFRGHRHFAGTFERSAWSLLSDLFLKICGGTPDDRRDWHAINEWASEIAREVQALDHLRERRRLHLSVRGRP